jgi:hypothetical protein
MLEVSTAGRCSCISCERKDCTANEIEINRRGGIYKGTNIVSFAVCDICLKELAIEFKGYSD